MNQPDRCCIYQAHNCPCKISKTREAQLLQMELLFRKEGVLLVLKLTASSSLKIKDFACNCSSLSSVLPWLKLGWFQIGVHKRYVGARERHMEKEASII
jgi:hypothetical protein